MQLSSNMNSSVPLSEKLPQIRDYVIEVLRDNEDRSIYTTIGRVYRLENNMNIILKEENVTDKENELLHLLLYVDNIRQARSKLKKIDFDQAAKEADKVVNKICEKFDLGEDLKKELAEAVKQTQPIGETDRMESKIYRDTMLMEFTGPNGRDNLKSIYEEMILRDAELPASNWYDTLIGIISGLETYTQYGKTQLQPKVEKLLKKLRKERKELETRTSLLLKKELNISEAEIKKLRKLP